MSLNFPSLPAVNDLYTLGTRTWRFNGNGWAVVPPQGELGYTGSKGDIGLEPWKVISSNYTASNRDRLIANASAGSFDITLPETPTVGDYIQITDGANFELYPVTILRNGNTIESLSDNVLLDLAASTFEFIYDGTTWQITSTTGPQGFTGSQGDIGYTGSIGDIGYTGSQGDPGTSVTIVGSVDVAANLPSPYNGDIGDGYIVQQTGFLWTWNGTQWIEIGQIQGYTGSAGFAGSIGFTGSQGITGFVGSQGVVGYTGSQGNPGNDGKSISLVGSVLNTVDLPASYNGNIGDGYIVQATGILWSWDGFQWVEIGQIQGYTGSKGNDGAAGAVGFVGSQGDIGFVGSQGDIGFTGSAGQGGGVGYTGSLGGFESVQDIAVYNTTAYTLDIADIGKLIALENENLITLTIPNSATLPVAIGQRFDILQNSTGPVEIVAAAGVTIQSPFTATLNDQYAIASLIKIAEDEWLFIGPQAAGFAGSVGYTGSIGFTGSVGFTGSLGGFGSEQEINIVNTTAYTLSFLDIGVLLGLETDSDQLITLTIPTDDSSQFAIGQRFDLLQYSEMPVNIVGAQGVTLFAPFGSTLNDIYAVASVVKIGANEWLFIGPQAAGFAGSVGYTGSTGFTGSRGLDGIIGVDGFTGSRGATGFVGSQGESSFVFSDTPPLNPVAGDRWYDLTQGIEFVWTADDDGAQWVEITTAGMGFTGSAGIGAGTWIDVSTSLYTASKREKLFVNTNVTPVSISLPAAPEFGDEITVVDATGNAAVNNITVLRNGNNIVGLAENLIIDVNNDAVTLAYYNTTRGWLSV